MEIERAREMGLCPGVRRAIDIMEKASREHGEVVTLGPVVHNRQVIAHLADLGAHVATGVDQIGDSVVVIPSHGVAPGVWEELRQRKLRVIDATCPRVRRAQLAAEELAEAGFRVVIFGDAEHPEVQGLLGWAGGKGVATLRWQALEKLSRGYHRLGILSQTTQNSEGFAQFVSRAVELILTSIGEMRVVNTICSATAKRQAAAVALVKKVDLMLVVGGYNSANTRHLAETCSNLGVETHHIEAASELDKSWFRGKLRIGITAGASTPDGAVNEVVLRLSELT